MEDRHNTQRYPNSKAQRTRIFRQDKKTIKVSKLRQLRIVSQRVCNLGIRFTFFSPNLKIIPFSKAQFWNDQSILNLKVKLFQVKRLSR